MAAKLDGTGVTYQQLSDLEHDFDDVETEIIRQQVRLTEPLYEKRRELVSQIPGFWNLVIEQAPSDIDEWIQPSDSAVLLSSLTSLSVSHFEVEGGAQGDPRSVAIRWEFAENDFFEDRVLEKKFWYRHSKNGSSGLVSEPVNIKWKEGKDLTEGLLSLAKAVWDEDQAQGTIQTKKKRKDLTATQKALEEKIDSIGLGGVSFFAWFGFRGDPVTAEESRTAVQEQKDRRHRRKNGEDVESPAREEEEEDEEEDVDLEIFPYGAQVAMAIADDLWPGAIKYFTQAQEEDEMSDVDFESNQSSGSSLADEGLSDDEAERPSKKRKA